ncbi:MAG: Gfo/Idh/MocA family protein [Opitutales bacterium]
MTSGVTVGVIGYGQFSPYFIELFRAHPNTREVRVAELDPDRRAEAQRRHWLKGVYADGFEMIKEGQVDAVAIFTARHLHFPFAKAALLAGKDVYSAVPAAVSTEKLGGLAQLVRSTGQVYILGEPQATIRNFSTASDASRRATMAGSSILKGSTITHSTPAMAP